MNFKVRFFGSLVDVIGNSELIISNCFYVNDVNQKLKLEHPQLDRCNYVISIDKQIVTTNQKLMEGNEIVFLPPFAGG